VKEERKERQRGSGNRVKGGRKQSGRRADGELKDREREEKEGGQHASSSRSAVDSGGGVNTRAPGSVALGD
jgi:hypothetical protein